MSAFHRGDPQTCRFAGRPQLADSGDRHLRLMSFSGEKKSMNWSAVSAGFQAHLWSYIADFQAHQWTYLSMPLIAAMTGYFSKM